MKNVPEFEGLRGFLSTVVVIAHLYLPLVKWVWGSMDIFFCMSGFLIGQIILKEQGKPGFLKNYIWRRITRIWPAYYVTFASCMVLVLLQMRFANQSVPSWTLGIGTAMSFLFLQNTELLFHPGVSYAGLFPGYLPSMVHTWSVALEEQFYLLAPIICLILAKLTRPILGAALFVLCCCLLGSALRSIGFFSNILPARFDGFAVGIFAAILIHQSRLNEQVASAARPFAWALLVIGGSAFALLYEFSPASSLELGSGGVGAPIVVYGVSAVATFSGGLILVLNAYTGHTKLAILRWSPLLALGQMSYSTYLAHIPVIWYLSMALVHWPPLSDCEKFFIQLPLCYGGAYVLYVLVERPVMKYRISARKVLWRTE